MRKFRLKEQAFGDFLTELGNAFPSRGARIKKKQSQSEKMDGADGRGNPVLLFGSDDLASTLCCTELEEQCSCGIGGWRSPVEVPTGVPKA